jgi:hypothetical protein
MAKVERTWRVSYEVNSEGEDGWVEDSFTTTDEAEAMRWAERDDDDSVRDISVEMINR